MFEREAEEFERRKHYRYEDNDYCCDIADGIIQAYLAGAEFGYNKAKVEVEDSYKESLCNSELNLASITEQLEELEKSNEWHKQSTDDIYDFISKDWSIKYFICIMIDKSLVTAIGSCDEDCNGEVSVNLFFEHDDEKYYLDDIVW